MAEQQNTQSIEERRLGEGIFEGCKGGEGMPLAGAHTANFDRIA